MSFKLAPLSWCQSFLFLHAIDLPFALCERYGSLCLNHPVRLSSSAFSLQIHLKTNYTKASCLIRKLMVSAGYVGDDEATAATLDREGWLKTSDLCYFDPDGFLFIP